MSRASRPTSTPVPKSRVLHITLWLIQIGLAALYAAAGVMKSTLPIADLAAMMHWPGDVPMTLVRVIGVVELAGATGLILPSVLRIAPQLTPVAAMGLALIQIFAIPFHISRGEPNVLPINLILLALVIVVVWGRGRKEPIRSR